jgi:hypothetical protein
MLQILIFINDNMTDERTYEVKEKLNLGYWNYTYMTVKNTRLPLRDFIVKQHTDDSKNSISASWPEWEYII